MDTIEGDLTLSTPARDEQARQFQQKLSEAFDDVLKIEMYAGRLNQFAGLGLRVEFGLEFFEEQVPRQ